MVTGRQVLLSATTSKKSQQLEFRARSRLAKA